MKYENAAGILPPELIAQIQKYAEGKLLYIPKKEETKAWGSVSGARQKLLKRNQRIYDEYRNGKSIGELAEQQFLSTDSIKKIIYGKKESLLDFSPTMESAMQFQEAGLAEEWLRAYYTMEFGEDAYPKDWILDGMVKMPLRLIDKVSQASKGKVSELGEDKRSLPLVLTFTEGKFVLQGTEEMLEKLKNRQVNAHPAFIFVTNKEEYAAYVNSYGKHFHQARLG